MFRNLVDNPLMLVVIILLIVLLFGAKRLPDAARSLGRSMRIFKSEVKEMKKDDAPSGSSTSSTASTRNEPEALEGRVVDEEHPPRTSPSTSDADHARREA
ncbi:Sec-independent protein translocase subunit TatA [Aquipuribacter nitratireducens]|uniref:Sec-independent protein translocase protein TatA n=1 Tax=Aquipuribacter nitratireducens TaxID=650104 RepID=A0ABW0GII4_9MICO